MMKEISKNAELSREYTNHQIRKTTATGMRKTGFTFEQIAHVTKHKNLDSLKHYVDGPSLTDKENYNDGLFRYAQPNQPNTSKNSEQEKPPQKKKKIQQEEEDIELNNTQVAVLKEKNNENKVTGQEQEVDVHSNVHSVVTNSLRQAPNLFQNASFSNCNFTFTIPQ